MAALEWTGEDETRLREACVSGLKANRSERWPTIRELSVSTGLPVALICEIAESTHDLTPEGVAFPDPAGKLPWDPDVASLAVYSYRAELDPGHPLHWDALARSGPGDLHATNRILGAMGFVAGDVPNTLRTRVARGRISWTVAVDDALAPGKGLSEGRNVLRVAAVLANGPMEIERLFLDTSDAGDAAALAHMLRLEIGHADPATQRPAFEYEVASRKATCYNPFRSQSVLGARSADRVGWNGIATARGIYLKLPQSVYGNHYADWRDDLVRKALGIAPRMPEGE